MGFFMHNTAWNSSPHRRFNPLTGKWVLVSPHRTKRPWTGQEEDEEKSQLPEYDPKCFLCPGNKRAGDDTNPSYQDTFVFTNDFAALLATNNGEEPITSDDELFKTEPETGICRVICYSPRHDLTMARMEQKKIEQIISTWQHEYQTLSALPEINYVQIFENKGLLMGCSNPHPHGQVWATSTVPNIPAMEAIQQDEYKKQHGSCLLCRYLERELSEGSRILFSNSSFVALVPFWAVWPYETMVLPRRQASSIVTMSEEEKTDLADILGRLTRCYDNLFKTSFPYSMGIHQQPSDGKKHDEWHYHIHFLPPLLRSRSIKKHMVGYELLAMPQRDITAEAAAATLRALPTSHYLGDAVKC